MMNNSSKYISDIFDSPKYNDVKQSMVYNHTKAYPSVNSSNSGNTHSEENVRWLTKQFVKKPFIIQYDNNDMKEFDYEGSVLNAGTTTGGMVNIDGYIINSSADIKHISFDNTSNTMLGTHSINGDEYGYIDHQALQQVSQQFMNGLSESADFLGYAYLETLNSIVMQYFDIDEEGFEKASEYLCFCLSNIYKQSRGETVDADNYVTTYHGEPISIPTDYSYSNKYECSRATIHYEGELVEYIREHTDTPIQHDNVRDVDYVDVTYSIYYGIPEGRLRPIKGKLQESSTVEDTYLSFIYFVDIFGIYYVYTSDLGVITNTFPFSNNNNINFNNDTVTIHSSTTSDIIKLTENIYDTTKLYAVISNSETGYDLLSDAINSYNSDTSHTINYNISDFYNRKLSSIPTSATLTATNVLNNHLLNVTSSDLINNYCKYHNILSPSSTDISDILSGDLINLCDNYYCLPLGTNEFGDTLQDLFCLPSQRNGVLPSTMRSYVPVGFITSSGSLITLNYEKVYKTEPNSQYQSTYVDASGNVLYQQIYVEGYLSFFRRVCAKLYGIAISANSEYGNITNLNDADSVGWAQIFKAIQYKEISVDVNNLSGYSNELTTFFNVEALENITLDVIYNKLIAPFVNLYMQLSWSNLYDNTTNLNNNKYKPIKAGNSIRNMSITAPYSLVEDAPDYIIINSPHTYVTPIGNIETHKNIRYSKDSYTDAERLKQFLCTQETTDIGNHIPLRDKVYFSDAQWETDRLSLCQDFISFVKGCSRPTWGDNPTNKDNTFIQIPFKLTSLDMDINNGFDKFTQLNYIVDKFADYSAYNGQSVVKCPISAGYVQNVYISTTTLLPTKSIVYNQYYWQGTGNPAYENPMNCKQYELDFVPHFVKGFSGEALLGVGGFSFYGKSQGWAMAIPTLFRLYKDGLNCLCGRLRGTIEHAGVFIDYKLPNDIENIDFWFANTWLTEVRTVADYDIENSGTKAPSNTDGMSEYLNLRNNTLFSIDVIYGLDENGDYISFGDCIRQYISSIIDTDTKLNYVDVVSDNVLGKKCEVVTYTGLRDNIVRLKQYADNNVRQSSNETLSNTSTIIIENNKYYNLTDTQIPSILYIKAMSQFNNVDDYNKFVLNTTDTDSTNTVFKCAIKIPYVANKQVPLVLRLDTIFNEFISGNGISTIWDSNYPIKVKTVNDHIVYDIEVFDYITRQSNITHCLAELTVFLNSDKTVAIGHCDISMIACGRSMTAMDMNYLWRELYRLDRITWEQVSLITGTGLAYKVWDLGDTKTFDVTYDGITYHVPAMIIGFDQEDAFYYPTSKQHTITWLTNIYNSDIETSDVTLFNQKFKTNLTNHTFEGGRNGYNGINTDNVNMGYDLPVVAWLNYDGDLGYDDTSSGYHKYGIKRYTDNDFLKYVALSTKSTGIVYTVQNGSDYGLVAPSSIESYTDYTDLYESDGHIGLTFWLPSLSEVGLSYTQDDECEQYLNSQGITTRSGVYNLPDAPFMGNTNYYVHEAESNTINNLAYEYFTQPANEQNVKSLTMLTSSYYTINKDLTEMPDSPTVSEFLQNVDTSVFDTCKRTMYAVGAGYTENQSEGRQFTLLHRDDVSEVLHGEIFTDFCFITV